MLAHGREVDTQIGGDPPEPLGIAQSLGEGLGGAHVIEDPRLFAEWQQGIAQVEPQIDGLFQRVAALGEVRQGCERLLKTRDGFAVRRAGRCPSPGLLAIGEGLVPHLAPHGMVGQAVHLLS